MIDFGGALAALKEGQRVQRAGWNGKGMHVYLEDALSVQIQAGVYRGSTRLYQPFLVLFTAKGDHQPGWLPSQADLLADDWSVLS